MAESQTKVAAPPHQKGVRSTGPFILGGITSGHGVFHWFNQSFLVMLPEVRDAFALSELQVGGITSVREIVSGIIALPGGVATDLLRRHWGLVLACCMAAFGMGWLVMGLAHIYVVLLLGMGLVAVASSMWHLPGMAALSHHFSHRRGSALSFHGVGRPNRGCGRSGGYRIFASDFELATDTRDLRRGAHLPDVFGFLGFSGHWQKW